MRMAKASSDDLDTLNRFLQMVELTMERQKNFRSMIQQSSGWNLMTMIKTRLECCEFERKSPKSWAGMKTMSITGLLFTNTCKSFSIQQPAGNESFLEWTF